MLKGLIEQKAKGQAITVAASRKPARVVSLMDAFKRLAESAPRAREDGGAAAPRGARADGREARGVMVAGAPRRRRRRLAARPDLYILAAVVQAPHVEVPRRICRLQGPA